MTRRTATIVLVAVAGLLLLWLVTLRQGAVPTDTRTPDVAASDDGVLVNVSGELAAATPARDPQLGIEAEGAILLLRHVDMLQWHERCDAAGCSYFLDWASEPVDSTPFREPRGHENPPLPMTSSSFAADGLTIAGRPLGGVPDIDLPMTAHSVGADALSANLAASFRVDDGVLFSQSSGDEPRAGDLRIRYQVQRGGYVELVLRACQGVLQLPGLPCV